MPGFSQGSSTCSRTWAAVLKADDAEQALAVIRSGVHIDVLFTDVVMPGTLRSPEMAREAALPLPHLKILFTSGYTQNAVVHGGRLAPGVELLGKPYSQEELAHKLRRILGTPGEAINVASDDADTARSGTAAWSAGPLHVLVVEDDAASLDAVCEILQMLVTVRQRRRMRPRPWSGSMPGDSMSCSLI
jgi:CheY-like chemotaxis protein